MSSQRNIQTSFWNDEWVCELDPLEKLMFIYFLTNQQTNLAGVYKITKKRISFDTGLNESATDQILDRFERAGKVFYHEGYILIKSCPRHQKWETRSKIKTAIDKILSGLPAGVLAKLREIQYEYPHLPAAGAPKPVAKKRENNPGASTPADNGKASAVPEAEKTGLCFELIPDGQVPGDIETLVYDINKVSEGADTISYGMNKVSKDKSYGIDMVSKEINKDPPAKETSAQKRSDPAKPDKSAVDYFPHKARGDKLVFILQRRWGNDGYAFRYRLWELPADSTGHFYDCNDPVDWLYLQTLTAVSGELAVQILDTLASLGVIDPDLWREKIIWSREFMSGIADTYTGQGLSLPPKPKINRTRKIRSGLAIV